MSPGQLKVQLGIFKVLADYPSELGERVLGDQFSSLKDLDLDLAGIEVHETVVNSALDFIRVHLEEFTRLPDRQLAISQLLSQLSGHLEIEFDTLQRLLLSQQITVDQDLVLYLFGTPGQKRFDFMWEILSEGMLGFIVMVDSARPETFREARSILETFRAYAPTP